MFGEIYLEGEALLNFKNKKLIYLIFLLSLLIVIVFYLSLRAYDKYLELSHKFQTIEQKIEMHSNYIPFSITQHQKQRGSFDFDFSENSIFNSNAKWKNVTGPWKRNYFTRSKGLIVWNDKLVVGLSGVKNGDALVYLYDNENWIKLPNNDNKNNFEIGINVFSLEVFNGKLYASIDNKVKIFEDNSWVIVGKNKDTELPWGKNYSAHVLEEHDGSLYLGLLGSGKKKRIFLLDKNTWIDQSNGMPEEHDTHKHTGVYDLQSHTDGYLYAAVYDDESHLFVYKKKTKNEKWEKIGGQGFNGSWINPFSTTGYDLTSHGKFLLLSKQRKPLSNANFSSIWAFNGIEWKPVGSSNVPAKWSELRDFNSIISFKNQIYVGAGDGNSGKASIWEYNKINDWKLIGGYGIRNSWGHRKSYRKSSSLVGLAFGLAGSEFIYNMIQWNNDLVVGFGDSPGASQIWSISLK